MMLTLGSIVSVHEVTCRSERSAAGTESRNDKGEDASAPSPRVPPSNNQQPHPATSRSYGIGAVGVSRSRPLSFAGIPSIIHFGAGLPLSLLSKNCSMRIAMSF